MSDRDPPAAEPVLPDRPTDRRRSHRRRQRTAPPRLARRPQPQPVRTDRRTAADARRRRPHARRAARPPHRGPTAGPEVGRRAPRSSASPRSATPGPRPPTAPAAPGRRPGDDGEGAPAARRRRRRGGRGRASSGGGGGGGRKHGSSRSRRCSATTSRSSSTTRASSAGAAASARAGPSAATSCASTCGPTATQIAVLEGRALIEHYVSRPSDDVSQIHGNIYLGQVQNVLPGMEAAFVDIGTPKNAVLYRGDVHYDRGGRRGEGAEAARIEQMLKAKQTILCQVTKNPIGAKGARLTQEVSLPGPVRGAHPEQHHLRHLQAPARRRAQAAAVDPRPGEAGRARRDRAHRGRGRHRRGDRAGRAPPRSPVGPDRRAGQAVAGARRCSTASPTWPCGSSARSSTSDYRGVVIDDRALYEEVRDYVASIIAGLADRVELYDPAAEPLPLFERFHVHEQLHKALDRKVWLPSGGSLIIEHTEALTVIDVNTGKNVGTSSLEETVFRNNLEAADRDRPPAAAPRHRRHHRRRLHRHGDPAEPRRGHPGVPRRPRPGQDPHPGVRHLRARPGAR